MPTVSKRFIVLAKNNKFSFLGHSVLILFVFLISRINVQQKCTMKKSLLSNNDVPYSVIPFRNIFRSVRYTVIVD